jgi:hypothetical protein
VDVDGKIALVVALAVTSVTSSKSLTTLYEVFRIGLFSRCGKVAAVRSIAHRLMRLDTAAECRAVTLLGHTRRNR